MKSYQTNPTRWSPRPYTPPVLLNFLIVGVMIGCVSIALEAIAARVIPFWSGGLLPYLGVLVALEAQFSYRQLQQASPAGTGEYVWRAAEWVLLGLLIRILLVLIEGPAGLLASMQSWGSSFFQAFFDQQYLAALGFSLLVWLTATSFAELLYELEENEEQWELERQGTAVRDREKTRRQLISQVFVIGTILLILTTLLSFDLAFLPSSTAPRSPFFTLVFLVYFSLGMLLIAHAQYSVLNARWFLNNIPRYPGILPRWMRIAAGLILGITLLALLLPTGYSISLLMLLEWLLTIVTAIGLVLQYLIALPVIWLILLLSRLFGLNGLPPGWQDFDPGRLPPAGARIDLPWWEVVRSIAFWAIFFAVVFFSLRHYFRQYSGARLGEVRFGPLRWVMSLWRAICQWLRQTGQGAGHGIAEGWSQLRGRSAAAIANLAGRTLILDRLAPRQQILMVYLAMTSWMAQKGVARPSPATPREYTRLLSAAYPWASEDFESLSELFIAARYSRLPLTRDQGAEAIVRWQRIQKAVNTSLTGPNSPPS